MEVTLAADVVTSSRRIVEVIISVVNITRQFDEISCGIYNFGTTYLFILDK